MEKVYTDVDRYALQNFKGCHNRVRDGKCPEIFWPRDRNGYIEFCEEIGPIPEGMIKPSVGRKNHDFGYVPGNIQWEEHKFNSVKRRGTRHQLSTSSEVELKTRKFKKGSAEYYKHQQKASLSRWNKCGERERMSELMKGNNHAKGGKNAAR